MKISDKLLGVVFLCLALAIGGYALTTFPSVPGTDFGPSFFPAIVALLLGAGGIAITARSFAAGKDTDENAPVRPDLRQYATAGFTLLSVLVVILLLKRVGYIPLLTVTTTIVMMLMGSRWTTSLVLSLATAVGSFYLFSRVFGVPLPEGVLAGVI